MSPGDDDAGIPRSNYIALVFIDDGIALAEWAGMHRIHLAALVVSLSTLACVGRATGGGAGDENTYDDQRETESVLAADALPEEAAIDLAGEVTTEDESTDEDALAPWEAAGEPAPPGDEGTTFAWYGAWGCGDVLNCKVSDMNNRRYDQRVADWAHLIGGTGDDRGAIASTTLSINYGMRKAMTYDGVRRVYVYAWDADMEKGGNKSGWVREDAMNGGKGVSMPTVRNPKRPSSGKTYRLRNATETASIVAKYGDLKVSSFHAEDRGSNLVSHYLVRSEGVLNTTEGVPGMSPGLSNDTFSVDEPAAKFVRAKGAGTTVHIRLVWNDGKGTRSPHTMAVVYGNVRGRYGWVAKLALI